MIETSSSVVIAVPGVTSAPGRPHLIHARTRGVTGSALGVELTAGNQVLRGQFLAPLQLLLGFLVGGTRFFQSGQLHLSGEVDQHLPGFDEIAAVESNLLHGLADLGGDRQRFVRLGGPERLHAVLPFTGCNHGAAHRHRRPSALCLLRWAAAARGQQHGRGHCREGENGSCRGHAGSVACIDCPMRLS